MSEPGESRFRIPVWLYRRSTLIGAAAYLVTLVGLVGPGRLTAGSRLIGQPTHDLFDHLWLHRWLARSLWHGDSLLSTTAIAWPEGGSILHPDPLGGALFIPLQPLLGAVPAFNVTLLLQLWLAALAGWALARRVSGSLWAGWLGGLLVAASPYLLGQVNTGETETVAVWPVLLGVLFAERVTDGGRWRDGVLAGVFGGVAALGSWYHGAFVTLYGLAWLAVRARNRACVAVPLAFVAVVAGPALVYFGMLGDADNLFRGPTMASYLDSHTEALAGMVADPASLLGLFPAQTASAGHVRAQYLGSVVVLLALVGAVAGGRRSRWWVGVAAGALTLALGPLLHVAGHVVRVEGEPVALPYLLLARHLPLFGLMRIPHRWTLLVAIALAVLAARGVAWLARDRRGRWALIALLAALHVADLALFAHLDLRATADVEPPRVLRELPGEGALLELPPRMAGDDARGRYLVWQRVHDRPVPYSLLMTGLSSSLAAEPLVAAVAALDGQDRLVQSREDLERYDDPVADAGGAAFRTAWSAHGDDGTVYAREVARFRVEGVTAAELAGASQRLLDAGIDTVVLHLPLLESKADQDAIRALLDSVLGTPTQVDHEAVVWSLGGGAP